ncbi:SRPBCC family protein [Rothia sp. P5764]|uniref:SRPBCC family protein n=1 Tax=Rothia sp. P5764 TaxID=3402654 RepID=UPI003AD3CEB9
MTLQNKQAPSLTDYIATLTLARDIATERGKNIIDLPDLLMALALDAGQVGVTLRSHRAHPRVLASATRAVDNKLLKELGISAPAPVSLPELAGYQLTDRARRILNQVKTSRELALALAQESSGYIQEILSEAKIEHSALVTALEQLPSSTSRQVVDTSHQNRIGASHTVFLPTNPQKAWEFVSNPSNLPNWLPAIESLEVKPGSTGPWLGRSAAPTGKFSKVPSKPSRQVQEVTLIGKDAESKRIEYELKFPHEPQLNTQQVSVQLTEDSNGCICQLSLVWVRPNSKKIGTLQGLVRKPLGLIAKPAVRYFVMGQATAITRNLRQALDKEL